MGAQFISLLTILIAVGSVMFLAYVMTKFVGKKSSGIMKSKYMKVIDSLWFKLGNSMYLCIYPLKEWSLFVILNQNL